jgi:cell division protein FtsL
MEARHLKHERGKEMWKVERNQRQRPHQQQQEQQQREPTFIQRRQGHLQGKEQIIVLLLMWIPLNQ